MVFLWTNDLVVVLYFQGSCRDTMMTRTVLRTVPTAAQRPHNQQTESIVCAIALLSVRLVRLIALFYTVLYILRAAASCFSSWFINFQLLGYWLNGWLLENLRNYKKKNLESATKHNLHYQQYHQHYRRHHMHIPTTTTTTATAAIINCYRQHLHQQ